MKNYIVEISTNGMDWEDLVCDYTEAESELEAMSLFVSWYLDTIVQNGVPAEEAEIPQDWLIRAIDAEAKGSAEAKVYTMSELLTMI